MTQPNPSTAMAVVLIDELARNGVDFVVLSPGSRSGALALAADGNESVSVHVVIDERSAAFRALGRAKATGVPAAVIATSGTAVANLMPAIVEAAMSMTPLVVISADRPSELRGVGANQTIDQPGIFGSFVRFDATIEAPTADDDGNEMWRSTVSHAVGEALGRSGRPGVVHLNAAFREPTVPVSDDGRSHSPPYLNSIVGKSDGQPWLSSLVPNPPSADLELPRSERGLVIAGDGFYDREALLRAAGSVGWPVLGTALSGLRGRGALSAYHFTLADGVLPGLSPETVLVVGRVGPSQRVEDLIATARHRLRVDSTGRRIDPGRNATAVIHADPVSLFAEILPDGVDGQWAEVWAETDRVVREATSAYLAGLKDPTGPGIAAALDISSWETLVVASSLPVRDVDARLTRSGTVIGNRGASGIDGFVSTALGVASARPNTVALSGDLSFLHDSNGFMSSEEEDLVIVVADNAGGGLFDLLPQARHASSFERLFITPPNRSIRRMAEFHELDYAETDDLSSLPDLIASGLSRGGSTVVRVPVDRHSDIACRRALDQIGAETARSAQS